MNHCYYHRYIDLLLLLCSQFGKIILSTHKWKPCYDLIVLTWLIYTVLSTASNSISKNSIYLLAPSLLLTWITITHQWLFGPLCESVDLFTFFVIYSYASRNKFPKNIHSQGITNIVFNRKVLHGCMIHKNPLGDSTLMGYCQTKVIRVHKRWGCLVLEPRHRHVVPIAMCSCLYLRYIWWENRWTMLVGTDMVQSSINIHMGTWIIWFCLLPM